MPSLASGKCGLIHPKPLLATFSGLAPIAADGGECSPPGNDLVACPSVTVYPDPPGGTRPASIVNARKVRAVSAPYPEATPCAI
jgi:hypothetical protein